MNDSRGGLRAFNKFKQLFSIQVLLMGCVDFMLVFFSFTHATGGLRICSRRTAETNCDNLSHGVGYGCHVTELMPSYVVRRRPFPVWINNIKLSNDDGLRASLQ